MVPEAGMRGSAEGRIPEGEGWYVLNAKDARWRRREGLGRWCTLEAEPIPEHFRDLGFQLVVLQPGEPACMYHGELRQEDFLVVSGECILVIEEEERKLKAWDFVHCPAWTNHVFIGAGSGPCVIVMVGARNPDDTDDIVYPVSDAAARHGASVEAETSEPSEAYARFERFEEPYREGDLPG